MSGQITLERIDALLQFLPLFRRPACEFVVGRRGGERHDEGSTGIPYPAYQPDVLEFFRLAGQEWWLDQGCEPAEAAAMLRDDEAIQRATLHEVRTMLTWCVRGERFCDGHWEALLKAGRIVALLDRLAALRADLARP